MKHAEVPKRVEEIIFPFLEQEHFEIVDVEFKTERGRWVLRVYVDKPGGVTVDDCADISHKIEDVIEVRGVVPHRYILEVSSPGLDRPLKKEDDFERFSGRLARIRTIEFLEGRRNFTGRILGCREGIVEIRDNEGRVQRLPIAKIEKARLQIELHF